jgi:formylglycine-generating enzyme required for sulfatase activity
MPTSFSPADREKFKESFLDEGRLLHRLSRANAGIAQALDVGTAESPNGTWTPYLVLEWLEGRGLDDELSQRLAAGRGGFELREAFELLNPAALALAEAHNQGISHRDIKPANLFLARVGGTTMLKVLDFGIAKVLTGTSITHALQATGDSIKAFTPQYGTPEQFDSRYGGTGPWTDVFALALVFVELLTGRPALQGENTIQLMVQSANPQERPTPRLRGVTVSQAVEEVVGKALEVEPRNRFLSAGAFWAALKTAVYATAAETPVDSSQLTVPWNSGTPDAPSGMFTPESAAALSAPYGSTTSPQIAPKIPPAPSIQRKSKRSLVALGLVAGLLAVGGVVAGLLLLPTRRSPASASAASFAPPTLESTPAIAASPVRIAAGAFIMGSAEGNPSERPAHEVTLTRPFVIDAVEVTVEAYMKCVREHKCTPPGVHGPGIDETAVLQLGQKCNFLDPSKANHPVNCVDRMQAAQYCKSVGKRLPTEAEWEYAARGPDGRAYPWGATPPTCALGAFGAGAEGSCSTSGTAPVGSHAEGKSPFGVLDLAGNVREWVADAWDERAYGKPAKSDPFVVNSAAKGIVRGGSWDSPPEDLRASRRVPLAPGTGDIWTGFRCAGSP